MFAMALISRLPFEFTKVVDVVKVIVEFGIFRPRTFVGVSDQCFGEAYVPFGTPFGKGLEIPVGRRHTFCPAGA